MRIGVVGYGTGGRLFHVPYVVAAEGVELVGVVTRSPERTQQAQQDVPGLAVYDSMAELIDAGVDAVTITTPPETRRELVLEAIGRGVHVIADKPFAPDPDGARELVAAAAEAGVLLSVYQNRRWDADIRTLAAVLPSVGDVWRVESRFDLDEPGSLDGGPTGGLLRDMGAHLFDQMIWLFGPVARVTAHLDWIDQADGPTDAGFVVSMTHESGVYTTVSSSKCNRIEERSLRVYGSVGSFTSNGTDVQTRQIKAGRRPADDAAGWGYEDESRWGVLHTDDGKRSVPSEQGCYQEFYRQFGAAVDAGAPQPVPASEAIATIEVLAAARRSALEGVTVEL
ncbi:Gfo/Idh/MocA family protein [Williamsia maris]|uniref:Dehydrogenase n=1 Tax=Williamsia maris TaxID=72806 RepID=A0ABT1HID4_9NOCA|nr:Gfo/Idh/MocA family oxidoreductase [Williamsia maris]MCP2177525.1 putative dehydrogenase [Williamsia maris]